MTYGHAFMCDYLTQSGTARFAFVALLLLALPLVLTFPLCYFLTVFYSAGGHFCRLSRFLYFVLYREFRLLHHHIFYGACSFSRCRWLLPSEASAASGFPHD